MMGCPVGGEKTTTPKKEEQKKKQNKMSDSIRKLANIVPPKENWRRARGTE